MQSSFAERLRAAFAPPHYLAAPMAGVDISPSGVKAVRVERGAHGLVLAASTEVPLDEGAFANGDVVDRPAVVKAVAAAVRSIRARSVAASLPEAKSYLFETTAVGEMRSQWHTSVEQHLEELVPLPPQLSTFGIVPVGRAPNNETRVVGVGFARRVVEDLLAVYDSAGVPLHSLEAENFATARALLPSQDHSTVLIIDIGKTTTKICIASERIPRFATTIGIGGHAVTIAIQKYFGVTEVEARKIKTEKGIAPSLGNEECLGAMLSSVAAIRDEISNRLDYWQAKATPGTIHEPVSHALLVGGNATLRGLQEYLESALRIPVAIGDVFTNFASRDDWLPPIDYNESLAYATAIGLALHNQHPHD